MAKAVICLTSAPPGSGKTYVRFARFVWDTWLPEHAPGVHWSNFPVRFDKWQDEQGNTGLGLVELAAKYRGMSPDDVRDRVKVIPQEVLTKWLDDNILEGPWSYFEDKDINGAHIAIDEAHSYFPYRGRPAHAKRLMEWLSEIRHRGATVEFITQHPGQVCGELRRACGEQYILTNLENDTEPMGGCRVGDWLELWARWVSGKYVSYVRQERLIQWGASWKIADSRAFTLDPWYFGLYDSYSAPLLSGGTTGMGNLQAWQRYGRLRILWWFYRRNWFPISWRLAVVVFFVWMIFFGGVNFAADYFSSFTKSFLKGPGVAVKQSTRVEKTGREMPKEIREAINVASKIDPILSAGSSNASVEFMIPDIIQGKVVERKVKGRPSEVIGEVSAVLWKLGREIKSVQGEALASVQKVRELEKRLGELGNLVLISGDTVRFESGDIYKVGEKIDYGPYEGLEIESVDSLRRAIRLSDGRLVRLGLDADYRRRLQQQPTAAGTNAPIPPSLQRGESGGGDGAPPGRSGEETTRLHDSGYEGAGFDAMAVRPNGSVNSGAGRVGRSAGVDGTKGAKPDPNTGRAGGSTGSNP